MGMRYVRTPVDLEGRRVEESSAQKCFEISLVKRMCGLVNLGDDSSGHGRLETIVEERATTERRRYAREQDMTG